MKEIIKGKVKTVYETDNRNQVLIKYHDRVTAGNGEKEFNPLNKGKVCCQISQLLFKELEKHEIRTHYIECPEVDEMICRKVTIWPVEVVVRNYAAGSILKQTYFKKGQVFPDPIVEFYLKDDSKNDPLLNAPRLYHMRIPHEVLYQKALEINNVLQSLFKKINLVLVDFKVEFGYSDDGRIFLADEISPDSMRLWKSGTQESMDKDLFRNGTGEDLIDSYTKILLDLQGVT